MLVTAPYQKNQMGWVKEIKVLDPDLLTMQFELGKLSKIF
jgi:hypothetical protein